MVKEVTVAYSSDVDKKEISFWKRISFEDKISTVQFLREQTINLFNKQEEYVTSRKRLRRFYKIVEPK